MRPLFITLVALVAGPAAVGSPATPSPGLPSAPPLNSGWNDWIHTIRGQSTDSADFSAPEALLMRSLGFFEHDLSVGPEDLETLWNDLDRRLDHADVMRFERERLLAFRSALSRLRQYDESLSLPEAHAVFLHSQARFPWDADPDRYSHESFAHFNLLAALFARERMRAERDGDTPAPEWNYLQGRALAFIRRGGELHLQEFLEVTAGDSPFAELAWITLQDYLLHWERTDEQRAAVRASLAELEATLRAGINRRQARRKPGPDRDAAGLRPFGEWMIEVGEDAFGRSVSVYDGRGRLQSRRTFAHDEFEALGGPAGLFVPAQQPLPSAYLIHKYGAYAGVTLLVGPDGRLHEHPGGAHALDAGNRRLFLREETDDAGVITVLDLNLKPIAASSDPASLRDETGSPIAIPAAFSTDDR